MTVEEFVGVRHVNITHLAKELNYSRAHLSRVLTGTAKPGKKLAKALEEASNGRITYNELLENYKARHQNK